MLFCLRGYKPAPACLLAALSSTILSCKKTQYTPSEQIVIGNWSIQKVYYKPNGLFRFKTDVTDQFQGSRVHIRDDRSASYNNPHTQIFRQCNRNINKTPYTITDENGIITNYEYEYIRFEWQQGIRQQWLLGKTSSHEMIVSEVDNNGSYTFY